MNTMLHSARILGGLFGSLSVASVVGCSSSSSPASADHDASASDGSAFDAPSGADVAASDGSAGHDAGPSDAGSDGPVTTAGFKIVTASGVSPVAAAGDAIPLKVVIAMSDGTTHPLPAGTTVTWTAPVTVAAQDPYDAGGSSVLPMPGAQPTGFFISNAFRPERTDYPGTLFVIDPGSTTSGTLTVSASVGDAGTATVNVPVSATPTGNPDAGAALFAVIHTCAGCHGPTAAGSPASTDAGTDDGGDAGPVYILQGMAYPYPAPGLNNTSPGGTANLAADPDWNAALLAMAAMGNIDNFGVSLRKPMPDWLGKAGVDGGPLGAQDFADIYAFLKTQTQ